MANVKSLFTDGIPTEQRKFLRVFLEWLRGAGIEKLHIPNIGDFGAAKVALEAGFTPDQLYTYDSGLYGNLVGHLYAAKPIELIDFHITQPNLKEQYEAATTDLEKVAIILFSLKLSQLRPHVMTDRIFKEELVSKAPHYINQLRNQLNETLRKFEGLHFDNKDLRSVITQEGYTDLEALVVHLPAVGTLYEKMFELGGLIDYKDLNPAFNYMTEVGQLYKLACQSDAPQVWHLPKKHDEVPAEDYIYAKQVAPDKYGYWAFTRVDRLGTFDECYTVQLPKTFVSTPQQYLLFGGEDTLTKDDTVFVKEVTKASAMYYKQLFSGKDTTSSANTFFGLFVNGTLLAVAGFSAFELQRLEGVDLFLNFVACINAEHYIAPDNRNWLDRLALRCFLSSSFYEYALATSLKTLTHVDLKGIRTVATVEGRDSLTHKYLMEVMNKEKLPDERLRITYQSNFNAEATYATEVAAFLEIDLAPRTNG